MSWLGVLTILCMTSGVWLRNKDHECNCHADMPSSAADDAERIAGIETALLKLGERVTHLTSDERRDHELLDDTHFGGKEMLHKVEMMEEHECENVDVDDRVDCGEPGISHEECSQRECCWDPLPQGTVGPWCFKKESGKEEDPCFGKFKCYTPLGGTGDRCISWLLVCDGHNDCDSGFDEDNFVCKERLPAGSHWHSHLSDFHPAYECVRWRYESVDLHVTKVVKPFGTGLPTIDADVHIAYWEGHWGEGLQHIRTRFTGRTSEDGKMIFSNKEEGFYFYLWFTGANDDEAVIMPSMAGGHLCPEFEVSKIHPECKIAPRNRKDCGYPGITHHACADLRHCCFHKLNEPGPWCFNSVSADHDHVIDAWEELDRECKVTTEDREDCGYSGISEHVCHGIRGCCYHELETSGNWCYRPVTAVSQRDGWEKLDRSCKFNIADRQDCGFPGIRETVCSDLRGCCYHELDGPGPWCFRHKPSGAESPDTVFKRLDRRCQIDAHVRKDCGFPGIRKQECVEERDCCYHELDVHGAWCYSHK